MNYQRELIYSVETIWDHGTGGNIRLGEYVINFDTPAEFEGKGEAPCPDQLFLAALSGCVLNTFIDFKKRLRVEAIDVKLETSATVKLIPREGYRIKGITIVIIIQSEKKFIETNKRCAELACEYCHLTRSIESAIPIEFKINVESN